MRPNSKRGTIEQKISKSFFCNALSVTSPEDRRENLASREHLPYIECMVERQFSSADRSFFTDVARVVVTNPFTAERAEIDTRLADVKPSEPHATRSVRVYERVLERVEELDGERTLTRDEFRGPDRDILSFTFLFLTYHRYLDDFDELIRAQVEAGADSLTVPFAERALAELADRGFSHADRLKNFALFYQLRRAYYFIHKLLGDSQCMCDLRGALWNNIFTSDIRWYNEFLWDRMEDFSTLVLGATGTGKGSAAAAIGRSGFIPYDDKRARFRESFTRTFVSLNLSQFPEALIESELFGHKKGAFTGAVEDHPGVFATCSPHGSIFLDEIGEVGVPVQIKLLRVLQERLFTPVGSHEHRRFRGRVIAATNRTIEELRTENIFRDDFYYRLCSDVIVVPPLCQRIAEDPSELEVLVDHTIERTLGEKVPELNKLALEAIERHLGLDYEWPGNVRELEQCVRRILLKREYEGDRESIQSDLRSRLLAGIDKSAFDAAELLEAYCALLYERMGSYEQVARQTGLDRRTAKKYILRQLERDRGEGSS
ncbi:MAG: sigma 54-interacting transcriptional regulator [Planctomycetota bacterium]